MIWRLLFKMKARGEWLFWLNADDVLLAGALKSLELKVKS